MYCSGCGNELSSNAKFCGKCGKKVGGESVPQKHEKKKRKGSSFIIGVGIILVCVVLVLKLYAGRDNKNNEHIRATVNNFQNNSNISVNGDIAYYEKSTLGTSGYEIGTGNTLDWDDIYGIEDQFCYDNKLYYYSDESWTEYDPHTNEYRIIKLGKLGEFWDYACLQTDGEYYYTNTRPGSDERGVYRVDVNDTTKYEKLLDAYPTKLVLQGDYLYVISEYERINGVNNEYKGTWRIDLQSGEKSFIFEYCPYYFIVAEDMIYYKNEDNYLCSMGLNGEDIFTYYDIQVGTGLNISKNYIFYIDYETEYVYRVTRDGTDKQALNHTTAMALTVADEWLIYYRWADDTLYKMKFDGSMECRLDENIANLDRDE